MSRACQTSVLEHVATDGRCKIVPSVLIDPYDVDAHRWESKVVLNQVGYKGANYGWN